MLIEDEIMKKKWGKNNNEKITKIKKRKT